MLGNVRMKNLALAASALALMATAACGDSGGDAPACGLDKGNTKGTATTGSISGKIVLGEDARSSSGDLFIAVVPEFNPGESCPGAGNPPKPVANLLARCVDLGDGSYSYTVDGIPPRAEAYYVIPFLDTNANVDVNDPDNAGPDTCDLISTGVTAIVDAAGETVTADDITLGSADILVAFCMLPECAE